MTAAAISVMILTMRPPRGLGPSSVRGRTLLAVGALVAAASLWFGEAAHAAESDPPNIVFVMSDDQRAGTMWAMPRTLAAFGVNFREYVVTTSNCCPSRATYLTGRYTHHTGVLTSNAAGYQAFRALEPDSLAPWLQNLGYRTAFIGKYFNGYMRDDPVPPGWDEFYGRLYAADRGNGSTEFTLREFRREGGTVVQDEVVSYPNESAPGAYATTVFADKALDAIRRAADPATNPQGKPLALFLWLIAVNTSAPEARYAEAPLPGWRRPPSFLEADMRDKPREIRTSPLRQLNRAHHGRVRASQLRQLRSVDDAVGRVVDLLDEEGLAANTWGFYTSDNGRFWGEHGLRGKVYAYEESVQVPFRMMLPERVQSTVDATAANIDLAPTLLALAGDATDHSFDGSSLLPLLEDPGAPFRWDVLLEHFGGRRMRFDGLRNKRWTYVVWPGSGREELYDRRNDPYQLENVAERRERLTDIFARRVAVLASG